jgi:hypothetical protein
MKTAKPTRYHRPHYHRCHACREIGCHRRLKDGPRECLPAGQCKPEPRKK